MEPILIFLREWAKIQMISATPFIVYGSRQMRCLMGMTTKVRQKCLICAFRHDAGFGYPLRYSWFMCEQPSHPQGFLLRKDGLEMTCIVKIS